MRDLIESQIAPFSPQDSGRVSITGPIVRLNMQTAQILGMAAHELSTNAIKYDAFGEGGGTLAVDWALMGDRLDFV